MATIRRLRNGKQIFIFPTDNVTPIIFKKAILKYQSFLEGYMSEFEEYDRVCSFYDCIKFTFTNTPNIGENTALKQNLRLQLSNINAERLDTFTPKQLKKTQWVEEYLKLIC